MYFKVSLLYLMTVLYFALALMVYITGKNRNISRGFVLFSGSLMLWSFGLAQYFVVEDLGVAKFWANFVYSSGSFIAATFLLFSFIYHNHRFKLFSITSFLVILPAIVISCIALGTDQLVSSVIQLPSHKYFFYGPARMFWEIQFTGSLVFAFYRFYHLYRSASGLQKTQYLYINVANLSIHIFSGFTNVVLLWFGIQDYIWLGPPLTLIWFAIVSYAIFKYRILDIQLAFTRAGIFVVIYAVLLGIPFGMGFNYLGVGTWLIPCTLMAFFATLAPFIYMYFQKKAEERLLQEQHRYHSTLRHASMGMGRFKDLNYLLRMIVHIVTRTVRIEHAAIYLLHKDSGIYALKASRGISEITDTNVSLDKDSPIIKQLKKTQLPIVYEEMHQEYTNTGYYKYSEAAEMMRKFECELAVPCIIDGNMLAVVTLGKKRSGKMYSDDDVVVFSILANQSALAIENAMFYEQTQKTTEQLFKAEKMATIGTMADGLSHQINNRLHAMGFVTGDALDTLKMLKVKKNLDKDVEAFLEDMEYALGRIQENVKRGGEIVGGLLRYTRKGAEGAEAVELNDLLDASLEMAQFKIKLNEFHFIRNFNGDVPKIRGNFTQLQEVFFNVIDNAYDAMMQRKNELREEGYQPRLEIDVRSDKLKMDIVMADNGIGVKNEDMQKIFTPFFTTKATSKKGTGLGMYVIRQIIEENHGGKVDFTSKYKFGSKTVISLPIAGER